jgi:acyl-CoA synthetase (AMP-forming)/AMP-acid ligase II
VDVSTIDLPALRYITQAGGAMSPETIAWARQAFAPAELFVMYGQTEATARLSYLPPDRAADKPGSIGVPIPGVELRVVDDEGDDLRPGDVGELIARGDNVTLGYLDEPAENAQLLRDGWLWTGDLATCDDEGFLYLKGRSREILKVGGRRISPTEIEQAIERVPDVVESAVIGVPDELLGEVPIAFVVRSPGSTLDEAVLDRACRESLPAQLVPRRFVFLASLPRSDSGKLLRADLKG